MTPNDSFGARRRLRLGDASFEIWSLDVVPGSESLPFALKLLLENLLRHEDGDFVTAESIRRLASGTGTGDAVSFAPARVFLHDTNGIPVLVDLAAMREAVRDMGGDPGRVNPVIPAELTVDHSVVTDVFGRPDALAINVAREYERNDERYRFLKWGQEQFRQLSVVPPGTGIMHQINLEYLARVVVARDGWAFPDTLVGTDSHTTMVNGLGVLAWGIGGIEAEAAMLGLPVSTMMPPVVGLELTGELRPGRHRDRPGADDHRDAAGARCGRQACRVHRPRASDRFRCRSGDDGEHEPGVRLHLRVLPDRRAHAGLPALHRPRRRTRRAVERYAKEQGLWHDPSGHAALRRTGPARSDHRGPVASPARVGRRTACRCPAPAADSRACWPSCWLTRSPPRPVDDVDEASRESFPASDPPAISGPAALRRRPSAIEHGAVAIAAITSCTNTSNPSVMVAAGLLARNAVAAGLASKPWVKTSLSPGSKVVTDYLARPDSTGRLEQLGFHTGVTAA